MKLFRKKVLFKKVNEDDISRITFFLSKYFKKKISKVFYKQRYLTNYSQSYICLYNNKIIGHVGFIRYLLNKRIFKKKFIFSRHSSLIHPNFRKLGLFKNLCLFAINKINKNSNNLGFIIWPNNNNYLRFKNKLKITFKNNNLLHLRSKKSSNKAPVELKNNHLKLLKNFDNPGFFEKNEKYIKWKYFIKKDSSKYFINIMENNKKIESISIYDFNQKHQLRVQEYFGERKDYIYHIYNLLSYNKNIIFFHRLYNNKNFIMKKKYQTIAYFFSKKIKNRIFKKRFFLTLGDTDTFINYENIK